MQYDHKSRSNTSRNHNRNDKVHVSTVDPATHLKNPQCMGRDAWDIASWITSEQYAEVWRHKEVHEVEQETEEYTEEDRQIDMVNNNFINSNVQSPDIIANIRD